jgi:hypothetical protein
MNTSNTNSLQAINDKIAALDEEKKKIVEDLKTRLEENQTRFDKEKAEILKMIETLTGTKSKSEKSAKKESKSTKVSDAEILDKVKVILSGGIKLSQSAIMEKLEISSSRFKSFLQNYPDLFGKEGQNRSSRWFLK